MRISDWSSDVCSSDLRQTKITSIWAGALRRSHLGSSAVGSRGQLSFIAFQRPASSSRSEEHTSELQSLMRISYAVFCLKKKPEHKNRLISTLWPHIHNTNNPPLANTPLCVNC